MDLKRFATRIRQVGAAVEDNAGKLVRKVALSVDATVVSATPVDTGRARSNWQVEIGKPAKGVLPAFVPGEEGSTVGPNTHRWRSRWVQQRSRRTRPVKRFI